MKRVLGEGDEKTDISKVKTTEVRKKRECIEFEEAAAAAALQEMEQKP